MAYHIHYDLIIAWAQGAQIQQRVSNVSVVTWVDVQHPLWDPLSEYRIKPEAKPDFIKYVGVGICDKGDAVRLTSAYNKQAYLSEISKIDGENGGKYWINSKIKLTIDSESRTLKSVEII